MTGVQAPPSREARSRYVVRFFFLILLIVAAGTVIWSAFTNQRIEETETTLLENLDMETIESVAGISLNVVEEGEGGTTFVLLHDVDVAGTVIWDQVVDSLGPDATVIRVDLPGFGFSQRFPTEGSRHTVAEMAQVVATAIDPRSSGPVVFAGVGLGGEVAAEIAVSSPELVAGLVMIDVDFYSSDGWREFVEKIPWVGRAATYALETGGTFAFDLWAPNCETEGWCPAPSQTRSRNIAVTVLGSADSIRAFRRTPASSLVPSKLSDIVVPVVFIWSEEGEVPRESVDTFRGALPAARVRDLPVWKAHLDDPRAVADLIWSVAAGDEGEE